MMVSDVGFFISFCPSVRKMFLRRRIAEEILVKLCPKMHMKSPPRVCPPLDKHLEFAHWLEILIGILFFSPYTKNMFSPDSSVTYLFPDGNFKLNMFLIK